MRESRPSTRPPVRHIETIEGPLVLISDLSPAAREQSRAVAALAKRAKVPLWVAAPPLADAAARLEQVEAQVLGPGWEAPEVHLVREAVDGAAISDLAETVDASLIVVASLGHRPALSPSEIESLIQRTRRPVLRIGQPEPLLRWVNGQHPLSVAIGVDHSAASSAALAWLALLAKVGPLEAVALHVYWPADAMAEYGLPHPGWYGEARQELVEGVEHDLRALVAPLSARMPVRVRPVLGAGRIADNLIAAAEEEGASMLIIGSQHRRGVARLWSVAHQALRQFESTVLTVPAEASAHAPLLTHLPVSSVMVASDLTEASTHVLPYALGMLGPGGLLHLVHVVPPDLSDEELRVVRNRLRALVPPDLRADGKHVRLHVLREDAAPGEVLVHLSERLGAEVVCLASSTRSGLSRVMRGSTAAYLLAHSRQPVLLLGGGAEARRA
jgi:nucleotide-binding universal stress UspA family protein